jgi:hypothetical protein
MLRRRKGRFWRGKQTLTDSAHTTAINDKRWPTRCVGEANPVTSFKKWRTCDGWAQSPRACEPPLPWRGAIGGPGYRPGPPADLTRQASILFVPDPCSISRATPSGRDGPESPLSARARSSRRYEIVIRGIVPVQSARSDGFTQFSTVWLRPAAGSQHNTHMTNMCD